ncbi:MAG: rhodanese-like domain-containing protein [Flavobacteriales bacterium]
MPTKIIDVRTIAEYQEGHVPGSINIPLSEIQSRVNELKELDGELVLCCASGNRSGQAAAYLNSIGITCRNGGSWLDLR